MTLPVRGHRDTTSPVPSDDLGEQRRLGDYRCLWADLVLTFDAGPRTSLRETDGAYVVDFSLQGAKKRDIDVSLTGRRLSVSGPHKHHSGILRGRSRRVERFWSEVVLPGRIDDNGVRANLDHSVLAVTVPKAPSEQRRRIQVR
jgi:HSP20 family molecular chaperone IbpA